jgi:hypothetical protein
LDQAGIRTAGGTIYCQEHVPMNASESAESPYAGHYPYTSSPPPLANPDVSPPVAFLLGFIPGVGAIYNGQYVKGLIHVVIIGLMISLLSNNSVAGFEPLVSLLLAAFWIYMPFEAYHTAKFRRSGQPVDEVSGLIQVSENGSRFPVAPVILIGLGVLLLLDNLGLLELRRALRYWPVLLIAVGVYLLYVRTAAASRRAASSSEEKR